MMRFVGRFPSRTRNALAAVCVLLGLAACSREGGDLKLECEGQRRLLRGNVAEPIDGVRESVQDHTETYDLQGFKLDGEHECQVWNDSEIRCAYSKPDGTLERTFRLELEGLRVRDQVFTRGRSLTEKAQFEGECKAL